MGLGNRRIGDNLGDNPPGWWFNVDFSDVLIFPTAYDEYYSRDADLTCHIKYMEHSIDLFLRADQSVVESPWRFFSGIYRNQSPIACIMKFFSMKHKFSELALLDMDEVNRFHKHLGIDMKVGVMCITSLRDVVKFFNITIRMHSLDGHVDVIKAPRKSAKLAKSANLAGSAAEPVESANLAGSATKPVESAKTSQTEPILEVGPIETIDLLFDGTWFELLR